MKTMLGGRRWRQDAARWPTMGLGATAAIVLGVWTSHVGAGIVLDGDYVAGKYLYNAPVDTPYLMMRITYTNNLSTEYPWRVYPGIRHGYTSSGYPGYSALFSLGPNLNEDNSQTSDWDAQFPSVNPYPVYRYKDLAPDESWTITLGVWDFSGPVVTVDGGVGLESTSELPYKITFFEPGTTPGLSPEYPLLPTINPEGFHFDLSLEAFGAGVSYPMFVDPPTAIGYEYTVSSGPNFASVLVSDPLPGGDAEFDLTINGSTHALTAGVPFDLRRLCPGGVDSFTITGIAPSECLDPTDPTAFVTGLTFVEGASRAVFEMKPIVDPIPEPSSLALLAMASISLLAFYRRR